jgi:hypothetical protein
MIKKKEGNKLYQRRGRGNRRERERERKREMVL